MSKQHTRRSTELTHNASHGNAVPGLLVYARVVNGSVILGRLWKVQPDFTLGKMNMMKLSSFRSYL